VPGVAQPIALIACGEKGFATFDVTVAAQVYPLSHDSRWLTDD
jgi:hypothetical protein